MSQRSIIEINHDICDVKPFDAERFASLLNRAIRSGGDEAWSFLDAWGIRRVTQCHHSEDRKVVVGNGSLQREHKIP